MAVKYSLIRVNVYTESNSSISVGLTNNCRQIIILFWILNKVQIEINTNLSVGLRV